jgi:ATP-dependent helicase HrpB
VRLYSKADHDRRPAYTAPEIVRLDLADALLDIASAGATPQDLPWLEAPPAPALEAARVLLTRLGALDEGGAATSLGRRLSRLPAHPRLARLALAAHDLGIPELGATAAALLGERPGGRDRHAAARSGDCDLAEEIEALSDTTRGRSEIDAATRDRIAKSKAALLRAMGRGEERSARGRDDKGAAREHTHEGARGPSHERGLDVDTRERKLREALLLAFPDRVARLRAGTGTKRVCVFASGGSAELSATSVVREATLAVAVAVDTRKEGTHLVTEVRSAAAIEAEWLLEHFPERVVDDEVLAFDTTRGRVTGRSTLRYEGLELEATQLRTLPARASELLFEAAVAAGLDRFLDAETRHELVARVRFVLQHRPALADAVPDEALLTGLREGLGDGLFREALREACRGKTSFAELERVPLLELVREQLGDLAWELDRLAPMQVSLPGGRRTKVTYALDAAPSIASRLQDFFGMRQGPTLLDGKVPLVLHLRAPNNRDVQVTTDLANFWRTHYPEQRRMLMRRYPRHAWPEDPLTATPPAPGPRR